MDTFDAAQLGMQGDLSIEQSALGVRIGLLNSAQQNAQYMPSWAYKPEFGNTKFWQFIGDTPSMLLILDGNQVVLKTTVRVDKTTGLQRAYSRFVTNIPRVRDLALAQTGSGLTFRLAEILTNPGSQQLALILPPKNVAEVKAETTVFADAPESSDSIMEQAMQQVAFADPTPQTVQTPVGYGMPLEKPTTTISRAPASTGKDLGELLASFASQATAGG